MLFGGGGEKQAGEDIYMEGLMNIANKVDEEYQRTRFDGGCKIADLVRLGCQDT